MKRLVAVVAAVVAVSVVGIYATHWPFTKSHMEQALGHFSACHVYIARFRPVFLPHPGYIAEDMRFSRIDRSGKTVTLARLNRVDCISTWWAVLLLRPHGKVLRLSGLRVQIPSPPPPPVRYPAKRERTVEIADLFADGAALSIAPPQTGAEPFELQFVRLHLAELAKGKPVRLETTVHNARRPGELRVRGQVKIPSLHDPGAILLQGSYLLQDADLRQVHNLEGRVRARGDFQGPLKACNVRGQVNVTGFGLESSGHQRDLASDFEAVVNGLNGDVDLPKVQSRFGQSELDASAKIFGEPLSKGAGKTLQVHITGTRARIEDLLQLFVQRSPAMVGPIRLRAEIQFPPEHRPALERVRMQGDFQIQKATFSPRRQASVNRLSARAKGEKVDKNHDPPPVMANLLGHVNLRDGRAELSSWRFTVPGAAARGEGNFDLLNQNLDVAGKIDLEASLSKAAGGIKSVFLIPLDPFFRKNGAGAELPFTIQGTPHKPKIRVHLREKRRST